MKDNTGENDKEKAGRFRNNNNYNNITESRQDDQT